MLLLLVFTFLYIATICNGMCNVTYICFFYFLPILNHTKKIRFKQNCMVTDWIDFSELGRQKKLSTTAKKFDVYYEFQHPAAAFALRFEITIPATGVNAGAVLKLRALPGFAKNLRAHTYLGRFNVRTIPVCEANLRTIKMYPPPADQLWWPLWPCVTSNQPFSMDHYDEVAKRHHASIFLHFYNHLDLNIQSAKEHLLKIQGVNDHRYPDLATRTFAPANPNQNAAASGSVIPPPNATTGTYCLGGLGPRFPLTELARNLPPNLHPMISFSLRTNTWSTYRTAFNMFSSYMKIHGRQVLLPVTSADLLGYIEYMTVVRKVAPKTIGGYVSGLKKVHLLNKMPLTAWNNPWINMYLAGYKQLHSTEQNAPLPRRVMTFSALQLFGHQLGRMNIPSLDKQVCWVAALWAFWAAARMSAFLVDKNGFDPIKAVTYRRVRWCASDHFTLQLPMPKNADLQTETPDLRAFPDARYCPVTQLHRLTAMRKQLGPVTDDDLVFVKSNGRVMTMNDMNNLLKDAFLPLFPNQPGFWSCHSFRAGLASTMSNYPGTFSEEEIQAVGRWNSDAYKAYCRLHGITQKAAYDKVYALVSQF